MRNDLSGYFELQTKLGKMPFLNAGQKKSQIRF